MRALLHTPHPAQSGEAADEIRHARAWLLPAGALAVHVADAAVTGGNGLSAIRVRQSRAGDPRG